jgi:hypothetical protein
MGTGSREENASKKLEPRSDFIGTEMAENRKRGLGRQDRCGKSHFRHCDDRGEITRRDRKYSRT